MTMILLYMLGLCLIGMAISTLVEILQDWRKGR